MSEEVFDFIEMFGLTYERLTEEKVRKLSEDELKGLLIGIEWDENEEMIIEKEFERREALGEL